MTKNERYFNELIGRCFVNGLIEDFQRLIDYIVENPEKLNSQHPLTLVTPIMCVSMWGMKSSLERLLSMNGLLVNLRAVNNYSAIDFARKYATNDMIEYLESSIT